MWTQVVKKSGEINDRKWELKRNDVVLGTIYHQAADGKYSLWVSSPLIYQVLPFAGKTHKFDTLQSAQEGFYLLCKEKALPWCREVVKWFETER